MRLWRFNWIVLVALIVHAFWGVLLLFTPDPLGSTPMAETPFAGHQYVAATIYLGAAALACTHLTERFRSRLIGLLACIPQQFLLMLSSFTAIRCVLRSTYADGVPRPWAFILADQMWVIVGMTLHTVSLVDWFYFSRRLLPCKIISDDHGRIIFWSKGAEQLFGWTAEEVIGRDIVLLLPTRLQDQHRRAFAVAVENGELQSNKVTVSSAMTKLGEEISVTVRMSSYLVSGRIYFRAEVV